MARGAAAGTQDTYRDASVVDLYDRTRDLQEAERVLFGKHVRAGLEILDLGVGAGRTTRFLAPESKRYVGLDYSDAMVRRCQERFPELEFVEQDASDLSRFPDGSFDVVVFSFNGLGTLPTDTARQACIREVARVLRGGGVFLFSLHNAKFLVFRPVLGDVSPLKAVWRLSYAAYQTSKNVRRRLPNGAFWRGEGYVEDPGQHNELPVYTTLPEAVRREAERAGLQLIEHLGGPDTGTGPLSTPHYYYACRKP